MRRPRPTAHAGCMRSTTSTMGGSSSDTRPWGRSRRGARSRSTPRASGLSTPPSSPSSTSRRAPPSPARPTPRGGPPLRRAPRPARRPRGRGQRVRPYPAGRGPPEAPGGIEPRAGRHAGRALSERSHRGRPRRPRTRRRSRRRVSPPRETHMIGCIGVSPVWLTSYDDEVAEFLTPASAWITTVRTQRTISLIVLAAPLHDEGQRE